ncbi:carbamoyl-phosphate synthase large subunit, partial [Sulfurovum sp. AR]|uniref:carbamoyl-phosphate synthase large subunit n=1 Tax=Sulfurovum sp. AR TaxID=1165841 RepID=UPI00025C4F10
SFAIEDMGMKSIMYNCNPETVSTDYDTSDVLYFEPIDFEHVRSVIELEKPDGVIVHFGGQTPLKLAKNLTAIGANISGTTAKVIDLAEDREQFSTFINELGLKQPDNGTAFAKDEAMAIANRIGYPVLVRPSFVLGGRGMKTVYNDAELRQYMDEAVSVSNDAPVLIDKFLDSAVELDVDAICDGEEVYIGSIMQHIEEAGIHSGDSACSLPPVSISDELQEKVKEQTAQIALGLGVVGLMNIQYAIHKGEIYLIEVNPRASRTVPFVSKATGVPLAKVATRVMLQGDLREALKFYDTFNVVNFDKKIMEPNLKGHVAVKEAVFSFNKLPGSDLILGPEMKSTGEVMGISDNFAMSFAKSQFAGKNNIPLKGTIFISLMDTDKQYAGEIGKIFEKLGFSIVATSGTYRALKDAGVNSTKVLKISEGRPNIDDMINNGEISLAINTGDNVATKANVRTIREKVLNHHVPYFTSVEAARSTALRIKKLKTMNGKYEDNIPLEGILLLSLTEVDKKYAGEIGKMFEELGFSIIATSGTYRALKAAGINSSKVLKSSAGHPNINDMIDNDEIAIVVITIDKKVIEADARKIRESIICNNVAYLTTIAAARATAIATNELIKLSGISEPKALQDYLS